MNVRKSRAGWRQGGQSDRPVALAEPALCDAFEGARQRYGHCGGRAHQPQMPAELRRSLTWDRGKEMAAYKAFTVATDVQVYFCDPRSLWQRGSNEDTNDLLRQHFPKETDLANFSQAHLDKIALRLRVVMHFAVEKDLRRDDPTVGVRLIASKTTGHHRATEAEIA